LDMKKRQEMADPLGYNRTTLRCPLCNSYRATDYSIIGYGSQPSGGVARFAVLRCRRHGVEFADALPAACSPETKEQSLRQLYGDPAISTARYVDFMDRVETLVGPARGRVLHDVGCGVGHLLIEARRRGWVVQGNDIVAGVKTIVEKNGIRCLIGSLSGLEIPRESCDVVTSFCVLPHHLTDPTSDMLASARILKSGGWLVLQFPDNGLYRRVVKLIYRTLGDSAKTRSLLANLYGPGGHQFAFERNNLTKYLSMCGFKEAICKAYSGAPQFTLARFHEKPFWYRLLAATAVHTLKGASDLFKIPNHSIVFARK